MAKPISEHWREAAEQWCELETAADMLESTKSSVMSQMMAAHGDIPVSKAEALVRRSQDWVDHVKKVVEARFKANKAKIAMEYWKMRASEQMSQEATDRLEAKL